MQEEESFLFVMIRRDRVIEETLKEPEPEGNEEENRMLWFKVSSHKKTPKNGRKNKLVPFQASKEKKALRGIWITKPALRWCN